MSLADRISLPSLASVMVGFGIVFGAIFLETENPAAFLSLHGFMIVVVGTVANSFMSYQHGYVLKAFKAIWNIIFKPKATREGLNAEIMRLVKWAYVVNQKGLPGLEGEGNKVKEPLLRYGVTLVATGYKPEDVRSMMTTAIEADFERTVVPVAILKNMASTAPAFGMVGTLVGMVVMLGSLNLADGGMEKIGAGLSTALLATLYGVVIARLLTLPAADKLQQKEEIMRFRNYMMAEGLVLLSAKENPRYMQDKLNSFLDPDIHFDIDKQLKK